ncbi:Rossman fold protein, TIGR00730 family [Laribacter hongkongensis]|uniref:LOG family protein n=1 Tax=Laribacter hongkongensis TaxID=168471 RepID=UPI0018787B2A|nr:TIGR00730 family Rossman fold protein [Laribacter hongkongensis]MBE5527752.1 Rossman fold protein, TIGR00730 family [Laribacter hongkongensis]
MKRICVFCGSNFGNKPDYELAAIAMGQELARRGLSLVYGGGKVGLMGAIADATLAAGGEVIGVIPEFLRLKELDHAHLTELHIVGSMHERKAKMAELADGFIAMPGGFGTFEEWFEVLTWSQLGMHSKPIGLLNVSGFYDPLLQFAQHAALTGFVREENLSLFVSANEPPSLLNAMQDWQPVRVSKWMGKAAI